MNGILEGGRLPVSLDCSTPDQERVRAKILEYRVGSEDNANSSLECLLHIKETLMDRGPLVDLTPTDYYWIRIRLAMAHCS